MFVIVVYQPSDRSSFLRHLNHNITFGKSGMVHIYILHKNMRIHNTNRYISLIKAIAIITMKQADIWMLHTLGGGPPVGQVRQGDVIKDTKCQNLSGVQLFGHSFSSSKRNSSRVPRRGPRRWPHVNGLMWSSAGLICCLLSVVPCLDVVGSARKWDSNYL